jgi:hypothetical protein
MVISNNSPRLRKNTQKDLFQDGLTKPEKLKKLNNCFLGSFFEVLAGIGAF